MRARLAQWRDLAPVQDLDVPSVSLRKHTPISSNIPGSVELPAADELSCEWFGWNPTRKVRSADRSVGGREDLKRSAIPRASAIHAGGRGYNLERMDSEAAVRMNPRIFETRERTV